MARRKRKGGNMLKIIAVIVVALVIALVGFAFYLGLFNPVSIEKAIAGPNKIACLDHIGPYKDIVKKIQNVKMLLDGQKITPISACGVYYDDPKSTPSDKLRSKGGYLVEGIVKIPILENLYIPQREVVIAKVKAHPAIAPIKTFPKINKWLAVNNFVVAGPCLEIYHKNRVVEVQMPIAAKKE